MGKMTDEQIEEVIKEVTNDELLRIAKSVTSKEEKQFIKLDTELRFVNCLEMECEFNGFFTIVEFKKKVVSCPHCETKHNARCFKNGNTRVSLYKNKKKAQ